MKKLSYEEALRDILHEDSRYDEQAYHFVREALDHTIKLLNKIEGPDRHVTGQELLEGIRLYALQEFGAISQTLFRSWGIHCTRDFGHIVFSLVDKGILGKTDQDRISDFEGAYEFEQAFRDPYKPKMKLRFERLAREQNLRESEDQEQNDNHPNKEH